MSVNQLNLTVNPVNSIDTNRVLGTIGMMLTPALCFGSLFHSANFDEPNQIFSGIFGVLYLCGALASATAMRRLRVTGNGVGAPILFVVQTVGLFLAMAFDILEYAAPHLRESTVFFITDMAYPFSHLLMIVVGIAVWKTGAWRGWRVVPPFLCGLALPMFFFASAISGRENNGWVFTGGVTLGFFLLGLSIKTAK